MKLKLDILTWKLGTRNLIFKLETANLKLEAGHRKLETLNSKLVKRIKCETINVKLKLGTRNRQLETLNLKQ